MFGTNVYLWIDAFLLTFFLLLNGYYVIFLLMGLPMLFRRYKEVSSEDVNQLLNSSHVPPVSIIIPMFNEKAIIKEAIASVFKLDYPYYSLIVVNDGSDDGSLEFLKEHYALKQIPPAYPSVLETKPVRAIYRSMTHKNFIVVDKERDSQEDALNAGLNVCMTPFYLATDADSLLEPDVLKKLAIPLLTRPNTIGLGGVLRLSNDCVIKDGEVKEVRIPKKYLTKMQLLEYLRGFFFGRLGWNMVGGPYNLSGAFAFFEKKTVMDTGGYGKKVPASDVDLTLRVHGKMHEEKRDYNLEYIPDATVWMQGPEGYKDVSLQRKRWYCSSFDVFWKNKHMIFNPTYGRVGFFYLPYLIFGEGLGPLVEAFGYLYILFTLLVGVLNYHFLWMFILIAYGFSTLITFISLGMEQVTFRRFTKFKQVIYIAFLAILENFGYRQMSVIWRVEGFFRFFSKRRYDREHPERIVEKGKNKHE